MNWNNVYYHKNFSHIYVEEQAYNHPLTAGLLARFPEAEIIPIRHYLDVFSPHRQDFVSQKQSQKLILAVKQGSDGKENLVYPGAPVCQDFGNRHFYYTSSIMNCPYDCEYCYLQGMYPSANLVLFVNLEDIFRQTELLLAEHPVYLCISYDTDLLALEGLTGYVRRWIDFTDSHPELTVECRTKSAGTALLPEALPDTLSERFILAWTLSPAAVISAYEHRTPSLDARLSAICLALERGYRVRLCFDPILRLPGWQEIYHTLFQTVFDAIAARCPASLADGQIADVSLGTFRISKEYLGQMRRNRPLSPVVQYPFQTEAGVCSYGDAADREMMDFARKELLRWIPEERIFLWK